MLLYANLKSEKGANIIKTDSEIIGEFIAEMRKEKALTQKDLAKQLHVSDKTISKWERGLSLPDMLLIMPLCDALDVTSTELLLGEKSTNRKSMSELQIDDVLKKIVYSHKIKTQIEPLKKTNSILILFNSICFLTYFLVFSFAFYTAVNIEILDVAFLPVIGPTFSILSLIIIFLNAFIIITTLLFFFRKSLIYVFSLSHYLGACLSALYFNSSLTSLDVAENFDATSWVIEFVQIYVAGIIIAVVLNIVAFIVFVKRRKI